MQDDELIQNNNIIIPKIEQLEINFNQESQAHIQTQNDFDQYRQEALETKFFFTNNAAA